MKKISLILFVISILNSFGYSQSNECEYYDGILWIVIDDNTIAPINKAEIYTKNENFNEILKKFKTKKYTQVFPYSRNEYLLNVYKIEFDGRTDNFIKELKEKKIEKLKKIIKRPKEKLIALYEPSDHMWTIGWLWHLEKIQADLAWDITKGNPSIKIAIIDTWFDVEHPDLNQKIAPHNDPFDGEQFYASNQHNNHGTTVASFVAAETDGGGQLASVGFNCMIIGYKAWSGDYLERAHHASLAMNADILTSSAGGWRCSNTLIEVERIAVQEILDNGTVIVMPAGNGVNGTHCRPYGDNIDQPWFPLHPAYDERIIIVSSTDENDKHTYIVDGIDKTHSHFPEVDLCAPGYEMMGAESTLNADGTTNNWPYSGWATGTSFATPIVAGVCALIKSVNPDLTPAEIQVILKSTTDPIDDADQYLGLVGTGRVNAYKAVRLASCDNSIGVPGMPITSPSGYPTFEMQLGAMQRINIVKSPGASPLTGNWWLSGNSVQIINTYDGAGILVEAVNTGLTNFYATTSNDCGTSPTGGGLIKVSKDGGGGLPIPLSITPNPGKNFVNLDYTPKKQNETYLTEREQPIYEISIYSKEMELIYHNKTTETKLIFNTSGLKEGFYYVNIRKGKDIVQKQFIIKHD